MTHLLTAEPQLRADADAAGVVKLVVGAVVHHAGQVLILRRGKDDFLPGIEELPSGGVEDGENLAEALARELAEEIGWDGPLTPDPGFVSQFDYETGSGRRARQLTVSVAWNRRDIRLSDEHTEYRWIDPASVVMSDLTPESVRVIGEWAAAQF